MPKLTIDGNEIEVRAGISVLQACEEADIEIPRFCYHEKLSIAGNCRMCLVEIEKMPKLAASCAMPVGDGMVVHTLSDKVKNARKSAIEFELLNHPLDCPICDQGGECDLQDQAMFFGSDKSLSHEAKHAVVTKNMGPLIKTYMTRCIHCTRCVRFMAEIAGEEDIGMINRGGHAEITTYLNKGITSELSGNLADVCPVGALTHGPVQFSARSWELRKTESVDVMDAVGSNIRIDCKGDKVVRILPLQNEQVNEVWLSDKSRYHFDGLANMRLDTPWVRSKKGLEPASFDEAFLAIKEKLAGIGTNKSSIIIGDMTSVEEAFIMKKLAEKLEISRIECRQNGANYDVSDVANYSFNSQIEGIEEADFILFVGANPKLEATLINARVRKRWLRGGLNVAVLGGIEHADYDLTYGYQYLGDDIKTLTDIANGKHAICEDIKAASQPMVIVSENAFIGDNGASVQALAAKAAVKLCVIKDAKGDEAAYNGFNVLHNAAGRVGALMVGCVDCSNGGGLNAILTDAKAGNLGMVFLYGADELDFEVLESEFKVYFGSHGDKGASNADVILPIAAYHETNGSFVNCEGRLQFAKRAKFPFGDAKDGWAVIRALSEVLSAKLPYNSFDEVNAAMLDELGEAASYGEVVEKDVSKIKELAKAKIKANNGKIATVKVDYYLSNPIARASQVMHKCSEYGASESKLTQDNKMNIEEA